MTAASSLNIVFAGTPAFALPSVQALHQSQHQVRAVYTQPDRPAGRGQKLQASPVKQWAAAQQLPIYQPVNFKTPEAIEELKALAPDVMVVIAYGLILPKQVLAIPRYGCINVHASLLPRWRGAAPIQYALLHGDHETGVTIMQMDAGMDTGPMLKQVTCTILPNDTSQILHDRLAKLAIEPLLATLNALASPNLSATPQNTEQATYAHKISKEQARIQWQHTASEINQLIRAFTPWPIAYTTLPDGQTVRVHHANIVSHTANSCSPGTILTIDKMGIVVNTGCGQIRLERIQFAGGKIITVADWLNTQGHQHLVQQILQ